MSRSAPCEIVAGTILEFFESKEIVCGVCTAVKNNRLSILTEHNREVSLAQSRVIHFGRDTIDPKLGRDGQVEKLRAVTALRWNMTRSVDVAELWDLLEAEEEGFEGEDLAGFAYSGPLTEHHVAAVQRILHQDRLYFQYKDGLFFARSREKVEQRRIEIEREAEREARLERSSQWVEAVWNRKPRAAIDEQDALIQSLKDYAILGQESPEGVFVKELFKRAGVPPQPQSAFKLMVRLGLWTENENLYLHEQGISPRFPEEVDRLAETISLPDSDREQRRDLRHLQSFTVDNILTRDYDDALSLAAMEDGSFEVGIHIADAAGFVRKGDPLDREAENRATSIYLPDTKVSMLPSRISEDVCSLKAGVDRPALSFLLRVDREGAVRSSEIVPSMVRVREQMTYQEVNDRVGRDESLSLMCDLAVKLRSKRLENGAQILPLPEIQVYVNPAGMIQVSRYEKETPSQIMVSEWMIAANSSAAVYLTERNIPSIFRAQGECKQETDFTQSEHELFYIYRQRRLFARAELDTRAKLHCSLALPHYTTVTSPIRRYTDLVVQRQLKQAIMNEPELYTEDELRQLITKLAAQQSKISFIQRKWTRYWILKYLEQEDVHTLNALILEKNDRFAHLLLPDLFIETNAPVTENARFHPGEMIRVKIEKLNPREDLLRVQLPDFAK